MTRSLGDSTLEELKERGLGQGIEILLKGKGSHEPCAEHPMGELFRLERFNVIPRNKAERAVDNVDSAIGHIASHENSHETWLTEVLEKIWSDDPNESRGALSELLAFGTLLRVFPECTPIPTGKTPTPDFRVHNELNVEIYCPRRSYQNKEMVEKEFSKQTGSVKLAKSYPHTGSGGLSRRFHANKVIDRLVSGKRECKQVVQGEANILYVDALSEWGLTSVDIMPYRTNYSMNTQWIGTFGAWHAFYGEERRRILLRDRSTLLLPHSYEQYQQGLFRTGSDKTWSGSIIVLLDGIVFFENPWAVTPISDSVRRKLLQLPRMRIEHSWYSMPGRDLRYEIENTLDKMEWIFDAKKL